MLDGNDIQQQVVQKRCHHHPIGGVRCNAEPVRRISWDDHRWSHFCHDHLDSRSIDEMRPASSEYTAVAMAGCRQILDGRRTYAEVMAELDQLKQRRSA